MAHSSGAKSQVAFIAEVTWGTTPGTPTMQAIPFKTFNLKPAVDSYRSAQMAPDRQIRGVTLGVTSASAELTAEFVPEVFDSFLESVCCGAWTADVLKIGVVDKFFTLEEWHSDVARCRTGKGMICNKFSLSYKAGMVDVSFSFAGKSYALGTASGATSVTAIPSHSPCDSITATISEGGSAIATVTALDFTIENALDIGKPANATSASGYAVGMAKITGKLNAYFADDAQLVKFLAGTESALTLTIGVAAGGIYEFDMSSIKYTGADSPVDKEGLLATSLDFEAIYNSGDASAIKITRTPHA